MQTRQKKLSEPFNKFTPLKTAARGKLREAIIRQRQNCKKMQQQIRKLAKEKNRLVKLDKGMDAELNQVMKTAKTTNEFVKLFWKEQQKMFARNTKGQY